MYGLCIASRPRQARIAVVCSGLLLPVVVGCLNRSSDESRSAPASFRQVERPAFNVRAAQAAVPLYWMDDANRNNALDPREVAVLWGAPSSAWVTNGRLTTRFADTYARLIATSPPPANAREELLKKELGQAQPTLVYTDLTYLSSEEQAIIDKVAEIAERVERVHMRQLGSAKFAARAKELDPLSRALFLRNQSPWCANPGTEADPRCGAFDEMPPRLSGLYPEELQRTGDVCKAVRDHPNSEALFGRFDVVRSIGERLVAVPYSKAFPMEMTAVAEALRDLATVVSDPEEVAFRDYVLAAAAAFETDDWASADRAWLKMTSQTSRWFFRVAPDQVFFSPCRRKAMFHVSFGRVDRSGIAWKRKIAMIQSRMEEELSDLAGPAYAARPVELSLPDFVRVILNAGDSRRPRGAYIGNNLPTAGPLAKAGRARSISFVNMYADRDSRALIDATINDYFCAETAPRLSSAPKPRIINTLLHVASRGLGPTLGHVVDGRSAADVFGGSRAFMLDQAQAQTSAMYFVHWLKERGLFEPEIADQAMAYGVIWGFSHITRGVFGPEGRRLEHGHAGAMILSAMLERGGMAWQPEAQSASGNDKGCFALKFDRFSAAAEHLLRKILDTKARGDAEQAEALLKRYVDDGRKDLFEIIQTRGRRKPGAYFVYSFRTGA